MVTPQKKAVKLGLEKLLEERGKIVKGLRVGLICNQSSVDHQYRHAADLLFSHSDIDLTTLFGPQHGIRGDVQDNMVETGHTSDESTGLPVYSLYSETRQPTSEMLSGLDALIFDLQDVGCRVYTFIYTMANAMIACAREGKRFIVLDRPNPVNGISVEGNALEKGHESFVGMYPIPMRHGMTVGELALFFNRHFSIGCDLEIVEMEGWSRQLFYDETDAPWVMPSPNMPTVDTAIVFPGTVFFEGTQVSEGRGTTRPFEIIGAPFVSSIKLAESLKQLELPGVLFRAAEFLPTFQKHANANCGGVFLHVTDRNEFKPVITGMAILKAIYNSYPEDFKWKNPPYEYVFDRNPFDVIAGTTKLREALEQNTSLEEIENRWRSDEKEFKEIRRDFLLY